MNADKEVGNKTGCNINKLPIHVKHSKLERSDNNSIYRSICPICKEGILLIYRDDKTMELLAKDRCILCGQSVIYDDIDKLKLRD